MQSLGMRHIALNVQNAQATKKFYTDFFGLTVEWEPDPKNVYLTFQNQDNIAIHEIENFNPDSKNQILDHFGFIMTSPQAVDEMHEKAILQNVTVVQKPKQHRDGAYSFYMKDPNGIVIQLICHPPIVGK